jgi:hypothetical protein
MRYAVERHVAGAWRPVVLWQAPMAYHERCEADWRASALNGRVFSGGSFRVAPTTESDDQLRARAGRRS